MREILFRGKRVDNGEWVYGVPIKATLNCYEERTEIATTIEYETDIEFSTYVEGETVIPETIGQYTGLKDKNGTKIFEGDIVKTKKYGKIIEHSCVNDYDIFKVVYEPCVFRLKNAHRGFNLVGNGVEYEVIGNIHDNPELLKGE